MNNDVSVTKKRGTNGKKSEISGDVIKSQLKATMDPAVYRRVPDVIANSARFAAVLRRSDTAYHLAGVLTTASDDEVDSWVSIALTDGSISADYCLCPDSENEICEHVAALVLLFSAALDDPILHTKIVKLESTKTLALPIKKLYRKLTAKQGKPIVADNDSPTQIIGMQRKKPQRLVRRLEKPTVNWRNEVLTSRVTTSPDVAADKSNKSQKGKDQGGKPASSVLPDPTENIDNIEALFLPNSSISDHNLDGIEETTDVDHDVDSYFAIQKKDSIDRLEHTEITPENYFLVLQPHNKVRPLQVFSYSKNPLEHDFGVMLSRGKMKDEVKQFLEDIHRYTRGRVNHKSLLESLENSPFPMYLNEATNKVPFRLYRAPLKLKGQVNLRHEAGFPAFEGNRIEVDVYLESDLSDSGEYPYFIAFHSFFLSVDGNDKKMEIEYHPGTVLLAKIMERLSRKPFPESAASGNEDSIPGVLRTILTGDELLVYEDVFEDTKTYLQLIIRPPTYIVHVADQTPRTQIRYSYREEDGTLAITPVVDYGICVRAVADLFEVQGMVSDYSDPSSIPLKYMPNPRLPVDYAVVVHDGVMALAKYNPALEAGLFRKIISADASLGFNEQGHWPTVNHKVITEELRDQIEQIRVFCRENNIAFAAVDEVMPSYTTDYVKAEFKNVTYEPGKDRLQFDVSFSCLTRSISLEKLLSFFSSNESLLEFDEKTLVKIENESDLRNLFRMVGTFHAHSAQTFRGRLFDVLFLDFVVRSSPHFGADYSDDVNRLIKTLRTGQPSVLPKPIPEVEDLLRSYQRDGITWLHFLKEHGFCGFLADDMGLGKTLQALAWMWQTRKQNSPSLVVCPRSLVHNWQAEAERFFPDMSVCVYSGTASERKRLAANLQQFDIVVGSYGTLRSDSNLLAKTTFETLVLDEAQFVKNHNTKVARAVKHLNANFRLALTGTPIENNLAELWSTFDFLMPGFLGSYKEFYNRYQRPLATGNTSVVGHLRGRTAPFILRRLKSDVLKELPPKIEQSSICSLSEQQRSLYADVLAAARADTESAVNSLGFNQAQIHVFAALTKLRQICNHPSLIMDSADWREYESAKLDLCLELVSEVAASGRKVLVFSSYTTMLDIIADALNEVGIGYEMLTGQTKDRSSVVKQFNTDASITAFLLSMKAGGVGLNLTAADTVIIFDPWWNPAVEEQAIDRVCRIGQQSVVNVYRLRTLDTIEGKIELLQKRKRALFDSIVNDSPAMLASLSWEDVQDLLS